MKNMNLRLPTVCALAIATATLATPRASAGHPDLIDTAIKAGSFKTLAAALTAADLVSALKGKGPFTVFAPTDDAFAKLPKGTVEKLLRPENKAMLVAILKYHVVSGAVPAAKVVKLNAAKTLNGQRVDIVVDHGKVKIDGATVVKADIKASNGIIHVIDKVVLPSSMSIVEVAVKAGSFKTLATALKAAALVETLQGPGPFTVFAPTDDAFAKLPEGTVASLLEPENLKKLQGILAYHVVPGRVFSTDLTNGAKAKTVQGEAIAVKISSKGVWINDARVVKANVDAANGVIHVIDSVLIPDGGSTTAKKTCPVSGAVVTVAD